MIIDFNKHKITNSIGVYDIYKDIRKDKWRSIGLIITEKLFYLIIRTLNKYLALELCRGNSIKLPRLGTLELRKALKVVKFKDNKLVTNLPIDWKATKLLWKEDPQAKAKKKLVRFNNDYTYKVHWNKTSNTLINKSFFKFRPHRLLKIAIKNNINDGTILDAYLIR